MRRLEDYEFEILKTIAALATALIIIVLLGLLWRRSNQLERKTEGEVSSSITEPNRKPAGGPSPASTSNVSDSTVGDSVPDQRAKSYLENMATSITRRNAPIHFWGQFLDQNNQLIPGVKVVLSVRRWVSTPALEVGSTHPRHEVISDSQGRFQLLDESGDVLELVSAEKAGYRLSSKTERSFSYGPSPEPLTPDESAPVIIRMWKELPSEPLVFIDKDMRIPYDGTPIVFDLLSGEKRVGYEGDLRITLKRDPLKIPLGSRDKFDWHASIEIPNGGLQITDDEFMYLAPEDRYQSKCEIDMPATRADWTPIKPISFFAKFRDGHCYSRVRLEFRVNSEKEQTGFTITAATNPNGSRNLQP